METLITVIGILILLGIIFITYETIKSKSAGNTGEATQKMLLDLIENIRRDMADHSGKSREEIQKRLDTINEVMSKSHFQSTQTLQNQFKASQDMIAKLTVEMTQVKEGNKQVMDVSKQIKSLEDILKNPKQRGILGEYYLEQILQNVMPVGSYEMQYQISPGNIVDAVIKIGQKVIPVDSKFSLENYNRIINSTDPAEKEAFENTFKSDLKKRIDETAKYIQPDNGTYDFAFMFIPSETIYYDLLINSVGAVKVNTRDLVEYASKDKRVLIVSPNTFYAYLQTVLQGFRAFEVEKKTEGILKNIETLGKHIGAYDEYMHKLGTQLGTTVNTYNAASKEFKKIDKDVYRLSDGKAGGDVEVTELEKPTDVI